MPYARKRGHQEALEFLLEKAGETSTVEGDPSICRLYLDPSSRVQIAPTAHVAIGGNMVVGGNVIFSDSTPTPAPTSRASATPTTPTRSKELTVQNLFKEMFSLASEWQNIGSLLNLPSGLLATIKFDNPGRAKDCLREMFTEWLKIVDPRPSWEQLVEAVEVIHQSKAEEIRVKYCTK